MVMVWTAWEHTLREWDEIFGRLEAEGLRTFQIIPGGFDTYLGGVRHNFPGALPLAGAAHAGGCGGLPVGRVHAAHAPGYQRVQGSGLSARAAADNSARCPSLARACSRWTMRPSPAEAIIFAPYMTGVNRARLAI